MRMNFQVLKKSEHELELIFSDTSTTFVDPLVTYILELDSSAFAAYVLDHPLRGPLRLIVRTEGQDPIDIISKAIEKLKRDIKEIKDEIERK